MSTVKISLTSLGNPGKAFESSGPVHLSLETSVPAGDQ